MRSLRKPDAVLFEFNEFSSENKKNPHHYLTDFVLEKIEHKQVIPEEAVLPDEPAEVGEIVEKPSFEEIRDEIFARYEQEALKQKESILEQAEDEAESLRSSEKEAGFREGYDEGFNRGKEQAYFEHDEALKKERQRFLDEIEEFVRRMENEKDHITAFHMDELRDLSIAVAEKVVNISLKSSGEVVKKMLAAATEKSKNKQWAKIYLSHHDESLLLDGDEDILETLQNISGQVKVEIMENKPAGMCIIEFTGQIIDASANTKIENINQILKPQHAPYEKE